MTSDKQNYIKSNKTKSVYVWIHSVGRNGNIKTTPTNKSRWNLQLKKSRNSIHGTQTYELKFEYKRLRSSMYKTLELARKNRSGKNASTQFRSMPSALDHTASFSSGATDLIMCSDLGTCMRRPVRIQQTMANPNRAETMNGEPGMQARVSVRECADDDDGYQALRALCSMFQANQSLPLWFLWQRKVVGSMWAEK